jgi:cytochrome c oxidase subunit II
MRVPLHHRIDLEITSADVAHSWWVPALGGKLDAIPGQTNRTSFLATRLGNLHGQCAEFCGLQHAAMAMTVEVVPQAQYEAWVQQRKTDAAAVGHETFVGVCAKCHGLAGQGDIGPPIAQSPVLGDDKAMTLLLREGRGKMPAVGKTWSDAQLKATLDYLAKRFSSGGGSGG